MNIYTIHSWRAEFEGNTIITFRQKLRPESSPLSSHFYKSVRSAETLLDRKARLVPLWGLTRGIPPDVESDANYLKTGQAAFWRKGGMIVQRWMEKRLVQMKTMIRDATVVNAGKKDRTDLEIKTPYISFQCGKFMKGVARAIMSQIWEKLSDGWMYLLKYAPFNIFVWVQS